MGINFDQSDYDAYDNMGRTVARQFCEYKGFNVEDFDKTSNGVDYQRPDLIIRKTGKMILVEAEVKRANGWGCVTRGLSIPLRKNKYVNNAWDNDFRLIHIMARSDGKRLIVTQDRFLKACLDSVGCFGQINKHGPAETDPDYVKPRHKCHMIRKLVQRKGKITSDDFFEIPYAYVTEYEVVVPGKEYRVIHKKEVPEWFLKELAEKVN